MAIWALTSAASGGIVIARWPRRCSSGSSAMNAASSDSLLERASNSAGEPVASTLPASIATNQSKRCASSM